MPLRHVDVCLRMRLQGFIGRRTWSYLVSLCTSMRIDHPPAQARIVRMMMDYELNAAEQHRGLPGPLGRWSRRYKRRMENKMLAIGDGAWRGRAQNPES